ncbi:REST corepressor 3-like isoform X1 [Engystomops pustulosus]|uniref:REST corepressor 3-like isoform X1 n=1 Tax=Engystomops pustulosus TaxID=76066 RepID=UPI003AFA774A
MLRLPEIGEPSTEVFCTKLWSPDHNIPDDELDEYINITKTEHGYNEEQALALLHINNYDIKKAMSEIKDFMPITENWSDEEKRLFVKGLRIYGKRFHLIQKMIPQKSTAQIVKYYYTWKPSTAKFKRRRRAVPGSYATETKRAKKQENKDFNNPNCSAQLDTSNQCRLPREDTSTASRPSKEDTSTASRPLRQDTSTASRPLRQRRPRQETARKAPAH